MPFAAGTEQNAIGGLVDKAGSYAEIRRDARSAHLRRDAPPARLPLRPWCQRYANLTKYVRQLTYLPDPNNLLTRYRLHQLRVVTPVWDTALRG